MKFRNLSPRLLAWFHQRREDALDAAYEGALHIQGLEREFCHNQKICETADQSKTVTDYAASLRDRQLLKIRFNLTLFRANSVLFELPVADSPQTTASDVQPPMGGRLGKQQQIINKLEFIDSVIAKYRKDGNPLANVLGDDAAMPTTAGGEAKPPIENTLDVPTLAANRKRQRSANPRSTNPLLPRLGWRNATLRGISPQKVPKADANYEQEVIDSLRRQRKQNRIAIRWIAILLIVPLFVQLLTKNLVFEPLLGSYANLTQTEMQLNEEVEAELAYDYLIAKEKLEIATLLGYVSGDSDEQHQERLHELAFEILREAEELKLSGLKNLLADFVAVLVFVGLILLGRKQVMNIRIASNRTFLNLPDSLKVFLFILITDIFVGFHSAEGWEVILVGTLQHFGLPESKVFVNGFIATVPVIIDASIKFWIFKYLTRYSPATSAIYERMNT